MSGDVVGRGYTLAKGAIAEDVEEEEVAENGRRISFFHCVVIMVLQSQCLT